MLEQQIHRVLHHAQPADMIVINAITAHLCCPDCTPVARQMAREVMSLPCTRT